MSTRTFVVVTVESSESRSWLFFLRTVLLLGFPSAPPNLVLQPETAVSQQAAFIHPIFAGLKSLRNVLKEAKASHSVHPVAHASCGSQIAEALNNLPQVTMCRSL